MASRNLPQIIIRVRVLDEMIRLTYLHVPRSSSPVLPTPLSAR
jgi:hypothetical protein